MPRHSDTVHTELHGSVGVIVVDNPPVNAIGPTVREGIDAAVRELGADAKVRAIVLHCAGGTFMAGADIRKLAAGAVPARPTVNIIDALEQLTKPVVAALQGNALGGGLEVALGCHYRCAKPGTRLGVPEINIGLIPGAGGTQRLPRLLGVDAALSMIIGGAPVEAGRALEIGLIDRIFEGQEILPAAVAWAEELARSGAPLRRISAMAVPDSGDLDKRLDAAVTAARRSRRGETAPAQAAAAVRAAATLPFAEGVQAEARLFAECRNSPQARALQHLFMAERQAPKLDVAVPAADLRSVRTTGVLGGGTMGRGIVMSFANAGLDVLLVEADADALARARAQIENVYAGQVAKGKLSDAERAQRLARIQGGTDVAAFATADLVVEAVFEDMPLKKKVFADFDRICRAGAILATNTSALDIDAIAAATARPEDVLGLHFFSPAHVQRLVEVIRGRHTSLATLGSTMAFVKRIGKLGVVAGNCDGFIGNRMLIGYRRESEFLLLEGASPAQVDRALVAFGMAMGPHTMGDMAGLDVSAAGRRRRRAEGRLPPDERFGLIPDKLVEMGRFGQKTGGGYYRYEAGSHQAIDDPIVAELIEAEATRLGIRRRAISDEEIVSRCMLPLVNEGCRILEEGMAQRAGDIDVVWTQGYGFPRWRGGPMQYATELGLANVLETLRGYAQELGPLYWTPAALLERQVAEGKGFGDRA